MVAEVYSAAQVDAILAKASIMFEERARLAVSQTFDAAQGVRVIELIDGPIIDTDASQSNMFKVLLEGNRILAAPTNIVAGRVYTFIIRQDAIGGRTLSLDDIFGIDPPVIKSDPNAVSHFSVLAVSETELE